MQKVRNGTQMSRPSCCASSHRVGGEKVLLLSAAAWGAMTAFTPVLAHFCSQPIFSMTLARFLMGLLQGATACLVFSTQDMTETRS